jgi:hypothetical protein
MRKRAVSQEVQLFVMGKCLGVLLFNVLQNDFISLPDELNKIDTTTRIPYQCFREENK